MNSPYITVFIIFLGLSLYYLLAEVVVGYISRKLRAYRVTHFNRK